MLLDLILLYANTVLKLANLGFRVGIVHCLEINSCRYFFIFEFYETTKTLQATFADVQKSFIILILLDNRLAKSE